MEALLVLGPIFEADFHPNSFGFRPRCNAHQALNTIIEALRDGKLEAVDADLSKYFETIPHPKLMRLLAKRISDGTILHVLRQWLDAPVVEVDANGTRRILPRRQGVPQGGVISPLLANVYLNTLDWAVNDPKEKGQPVMVRYADDFVILCEPGQGEQLHARLSRWLEARGLKLNEEKTRQVHSREAFNFLGFTVRWQPSRRNGRWYVQVEPSAKSQQQLRRTRPRSPPAGRASCTANRTYLLQDANGQIIETHSISPGLDYPGVGPEHAYLKDSGRATYVAVTDGAALCGFELLSRLEGIIPALETSHAVAWIAEQAGRWGKDDAVLLCVSGRGDKDVSQVAELLAARDRA